MILDDIVAHKREELALARRERSLADLKQAAKDAPPVRGFDAALRQPGLAVIAEVKRKSPAKGVLNQAVDPAAQALTYEQAGARAVSVLTDRRFFDGANADLQAVRDRASLPVLRKDFTIDEYHVWEARAIGADAILLIVRALNDSQLNDFQALARELGMDALIEVHDQADMERASQAKASIIGINNRDLGTMTVDLATTLRLRPLAPVAATLISESGIRTPDDIRQLASVGIDGVLVGEALMSSGDPGATLHGFLSAAAAEVPA